MTENEREILKLFVQNIDDLLNHSLIKNKQLKVKTTLLMSKEGGSSISRNEIDKEALESLLVRLRRFNNKKDMLFFNRVINILIKYETEDKGEKTLRKLKKWFENKDEAQSIVFKNKEKIYFPEQIFDLNVNGKIFHVDREKQKEIEQVSEDFQFAEESFLGAITTKIGALILTKKYIDRKKYY